MDLSYLANLSEFEYEAERCRLIEAELDKASTPELRRKGLALQLRLDQRREQMSSEQFMASLVRDMSENIENISDQFVALQHTIFPKQ